jgi:hypothetical protein
MTSPGTLRCPARRRTLSGVAATSALAMVFKLAEAEQKSWRRLDGPKQLPKLIQGVKFTDGIEVVVNTSAPHARNPWRHET